MSRQLSPGLQRASNLARGDRLDCGTAQITAGDIAEFAAMTGDRFEIHMSDAGARAHGFDRRVSHGLLVMARTEGLIREAPTQIANGGICFWDWQFRRPILAGDKISVVLTLAAAPDASLQDQPILHFSVDVKNQDGVLVQTGEMRMNAAP